MITDLIGQKVIHKTSGIFGTFLQYGIYSEEKIYNNNVVIVTTSGIILSDNGKIHNFKIDDLSLLKG